jgi:uncharacterized membrane protein
MCGHEGCARQDQIVSSGQSDRRWGGQWRLLGSLFGLLFFFPLGGLAIGAASGGLSGALSDYGIDDTFMRSLSEQMPLGSSAIFMLVRKATTDKVVPESAKFGGKLLYTSVSKESDSPIPSHAGH